MNYKETLDYLFSQLPMFHRIGAAAYKADLTNTIAICKLLGNPESKFRSIHIAGTNGKGSSSHMLAAIYQQAGYKTGLYTSPHLKDFRERIRINGKPISRARVTKFVEQYHEQFAQIKPSFFEWTVGLAFDYFASEKVDVAIIEVGLGGRLDSTNVTRPVVSLITNISYDHMNLLGDTLGKIAAEKAGIIKTGIPVVVSQAQKETKNIFEQAAKERKASLVFADKLFKVTDEEYLPRSSKSRYTLRRRNETIKLTCDLAGAYQAKNIPGVLAVIEEAASVLPVSSRAVNTALSNVTGLTGLQGRWQVLRKSPRVIADTGHNEDGLKEVLKCVDREYASGLVSGRLHVVFGVVNDKDVQAVFKLLRGNRHFREAGYYFCKPAIPRGMEAQALADQALRFGLKGKVFPSVKKSLAAAVRAAGSRELVFVGGSTFTVSEVV